MRAWLLAIVVACAGCERTRESQPIAPGSALRDLSASLTPLREAFNAHVHEPRFIALLSAT